MTLQQSTLAHSVDSLALWREALGREAATLSRFAAEHDLVDESDFALLSALRERLAGETLVLAFVAEFSRGKSELINAIFFWDAGRRVLPAAPGRTTMCPVELRHDPALPPRLSLLPLASRLEAASLGELRRRDEAWRHLPLDPADPHATAAALAEVTRTERVALGRARALGLLPDRDGPAGPADVDIDIGVDIGVDSDSDAGKDAGKDAGRRAVAGPAVVGALDDEVEVPAWRHALINFPHPLLQHGLVVIDTPGLNAIGAEPELTLSLLPSAHAVVFVLAADTGVTQSDLAIWRDHLAHRDRECFVALNKIDTLVDPLASTAEVQAHIERQRAEVAATLQVPAERVFPVSARDALAGRVAGDSLALAASRLTLLEDALTAGLLPRQRELIVAATDGVVQRLRDGAARRLADRRRQQAEQMLELRSLRGRSAQQVERVLQRVQVERDAFEPCVARLAALRAVQARLLEDALARLATPPLREQVAALAGLTGPLQRGLRPAFAALFERLREALADARDKAAELHGLTAASFVQLNADFGFAFEAPAAPTLAAQRQELSEIEAGYGQHLGLARGWRLASAAGAENFRRMLATRLRTVLEHAAAELETWCKSTHAQIDAQLRERRRSLARRHEALQRIRAAAGELEQRIAELLGQEAQLAALDRQLQQGCRQMRDTARGLIAERTEPLPGSLRLRRDAA